MEGMLCSLGPFHRRSSSIVGLQATSVFTPAGPLGRQGHPFCGASWKAMRCSLSMRQMTYRTCVRGRHEWDCQQVGERGKKRDGPVPTLAPSMTYSVVGGGKVVVGETTDRLVQRTSTSADGTRKEDVHVCLGLEGTVLDSEKGWTGRRG